MRLTIIHPCIGRRAGQKYIKTWQMEPLPPALLASLTPSDVEITFFDDRMESINFDHPADLVAISIETYTAKRSYQIASEYRKRNIPVVMGGFHASLCPEEVAQYADAVVIGEAETLWATVLEDAAKGTLQTYYKAKERPSLANILPDRSIYKGKRYLPLGLIEAARGCDFKCDFCAIQTVFNKTQTFRPHADIAREVVDLRRKPLIFFVDDNIGSNLQQAKSFLRAIIPLKLNWVSQMSINAAHDEEFLQLLVQSGCQGVLIGFESLNPANLKKMNKGFNMMKGGFEAALANLARYKIRLYITFIFGYDEDTTASFQETVQFAIKHQFYIAAFNHLTPFPGTPLYTQLENEGRLLFDKWWLDDDYSYNMVPFRPAKMKPEEVREGCVSSRAEFYSWRNIWHRSLSPVNRAYNRMWPAFYWINYLFRQEVSLRDYYPLGDETWQGSLLKVRDNPPPVPAALALSQTILLP